MNRTWRKLSVEVALAAFAAALAVPAAAFAMTQPEAIATGAKAIGAGMAIGIGAIGAGIAQGKIGAAGQGTLAERPEERIWVITLTALPEIIVLLGFVSAILIISE